MEGKYLQQFKKGSLEMILCASSPRRRLTVMSC